MAQRDIVAERPQNQGRLQAALRAVGLTRRADAQAEIERAVDQAVQRATQQLTEQHTAALEQAHLGGYLEATQDIRSPEDEPMTSTGIIRQGYRSLATDMRGPGDLSYDEIIEVVWQVYLRHPVAKRLSEIKRDHILGRGVKALAEGDTDLQGVIDTFWAKNKMRRLLRKLVQQLYLFGDQIIIASVRETDGRVKLGYIDPSDVEAVILNPENALEKCAVVVKKQVQDQVPEWMFTRPVRRVYRIVRPYDPELESGGPPPDLEDKMLTAAQADKEPWEVTMLQHYELSDYTGDVLYWSTNDVANQARGISDFHQLVPHLAYLEDVLLTLADRENMAALAAWDIELEGATDLQCRKKANELARNPPKRGSFIVHNDREKWRFTTTGMEQAGSIEVEQALLDMVCGGTGTPRSWFGEGGGENRATAREQNRPTWMTLQFHQDELRDYLLDMLHFVRDQAERAGTWKKPAARPIEPPAPDQYDLLGNPIQKDQDLGPTEPGKITLEMAEVSTLDIQALSVALERLSVALGAAVEKGWLTERRASLIWGKMLREIGTEYDAELEYRIAQAEKAARQQPAEDEDEEGDGFDDDGNYVGDDEEPQYRSDRMEPDQDPEADALTGDEQIVSTRDDIESARFYRSTEAHDHVPEPVDSECPLCHTKGAYRFGEEHGNAVVCGTCGSTYDLVLEAV